MQKGKTGITTKLYNDNGIIQIFTRKGTRNARYQPFCAHILVFAQANEEMKRSWEMTEPDNNSKDYQWFLCMRKCSAIHAKHIQNKYTYTYQYNIRLFSLNIGFNFIYNRTIELLHSTFFFVNTSKIKLTLTKSKNILRIWILRSCFVNSIV